MTQTMVMVQWADLTGRGFSPYDDGPPVSQEYWAAAEQLLLGDLSQPPEGIRSTYGHPVWTLRQVKVFGRPTWCFVVQGRRGPFGVAGSCRFAFAPERMTAIEAWRAGRARAAYDLDLTLDSDPDQDRFGELVAQVLGGVVVGQRAIPIPVLPAQAARVIAAALGVLPERSARNWSWSTCMLQRPEPADRCVVSGLWPDELRHDDSDRAASVDQVLRRGSVSQLDIRQRLGTPEARSGFESWVNLATDGRLLDDDLDGDYALTEMLVELAHSRRPPSWQEVPSMLDTSAGCRRLVQKHPDLIDEWVNQQPKAALARVQADADTDAADALLRALIEAQRNRSENLLQLPSEANATLTDWQRRLAKHLPHLYPPEQLRDLIRGWINSGPFQREGNLAAAHDWLCLLGIAPADEPKFFPARIRVVLDELKRHGTDTKVTRAEIGREAKPLHFLSRMADQVPPLRGKAAGHLLLSVLPGSRIPDTDLPIVQAIATTLTERCRPADAARGNGWVREFLESLNPAPKFVQARAMYGSVRVLIKCYPDEPLAAPLATFCLSVKSGDVVAPNEVAEALELARPRRAHTGPEGRDGTSGGPENGRITNRLGPLVPPPRIRGYILIGAVGAMLGFAVGLAVNAQPATPSTDRHASSPTPATQTSWTVDAAVFVLPPAAKSAAEQVSLDVNAVLAQLDKLHASGSAVVIVLGAFGVTDDSRANELQRATLLRRELVEAAALKNANIVVVTEAVVDPSASPQRGLRATVILDR